MRKYSTLLLVTLMGLFVLALTADAGFAPFTECRLSISAQT